MTFKEFCKELLEEYGYIIFQYDSVISFTQTFPDTTCGLGGIGGQVLVVEILKNYKMINDQIKKLANKKIPLYNNSSSLYDILDWLREKKFLHVEIQWYPHGWMFVIYKIDSQEDEPYDTFSEVYTSYLNCLEAGIIRALNII